MKLALFLVVSLALFPARAALASEPKPVNWDDLAPPVVAIENPFEALTSEQIEALRSIHRLESRTVEGDATEVRAQADALRAQLAEEGIDVDTLFAKRIEIMEQRQRAASAVNEELIGREVRIPGYVLPLEIQDRKAVEFLLVPTVGACIHTPPPPANQMVHVRYPQGIAVEGLYTPVWVTGNLSSESSEQTVGYVDGEARVAVSYAMQPDLVEPY